MATWVAHPESLDKCLYVNAEGWRDEHRKVLHATCQAPNAGTPLYSPQPIVSLFCLVSFSKCGSWWLKCKLQYTAGRKRNLVVMVAGGDGSRIPDHKTWHLPSCIVHRRRSCLVSLFSPRVLRILSFQSNKPHQTHMRIPTLLLMFFVSTKTSRGRKEVLL